MQRKTKLPPPNSRAPIGTPAPTWPQGTVDEELMPRAKGTMPPPLPKAAQVISPAPTRPDVIAPSKLIFPPHLQRPEEISFIEPEPEPEPEPVAALSHPSAPTTEEDWYDPTDQQAKQDPFVDDDIVWDDDDFYIGKPKQRWGLVALGAVAVVGGVAVAGYFALKSSSSGGNASANAAGVVNTKKVDKAAPAPSAIPLAERAADPVPMAAPAQQNGDQANTMAKPADVAGTAMDQPADTETQPVAAMVPPPTTEAVPTAGETASPVSAMFVSEPPGATVTLIENGKPLVLGPSPVDAELDPAKSYEVVYTQDGFATTMRRVPFSGNGNIEISAIMQRVDGDASTEPAPQATEPVTERKAVAKAKPAPSKKLTRRSSRKAKKSTRSKKSKKTKVAAAKGGKGTLLVSAKPPCDIYVDGRRTGLKTPQRLPLSAGKHKVKLINKKYNIKKTYSVRIRSGAKTKLIRDMSSRIK